MPPTPAAEPLDLVVEAASAWARELTDEEIEARWAQVQEWLPPVEPFLTGATGIVADGESARLTPTMLAELALMDIDTLDDDDLVGYAAAWTRVRNLADARVAAAVAALHARTPSGGPIPRAGLVAAEIGAVLRLGVGAAGELVTASVDLATRLTPTLAAVADGSVSWHKASQLSARTRHLDAADAAQVEARVLPKAGERTPARHVDAVRRAVDTLDPAGLEERRRRAEATIALVRTHCGDGMGELFARIPSDELDTIYLAADTAARRAKAAGDPRTLDRLRVAALVQWASAFLAYGDPTATEAPDDDSAAPPMRHGRPARVRILTPLSTLLGASEAPGELADTGAVLPAGVVRAIARQGAPLRRLLIDDDTGELLDLTPDGCPLGPATGPVVHEVGVVVRASQLDDLRDLPGDTPQPIRDLLDAPITAGTLDDTPDAYPAPARLAEFVTTRDRHPTSPGAGLSAAGTGDIDHVQSVREGGATTRDNLTSPTRRWHRLRTLAGWRLRRHHRGWTWTSPRGRQTTTGPYDYRHLADDP